MARTIIGITGKAGVGKSTVSFYLQQAYGFTRLAFADPVKGMLQVFLASQGLDAVTIQRMLDGDLKEAPTPLFEGHDPRWALQTLGTEWGRQKLGSNLWTHHLLSRLSSLDADRIVVDDVRMDNEAEALRYSEWAHQTRIWEVHALGQQARRHPHMHASEYGINELLVDASIQHDFTMAEMQRVVDLKLAELGIERKGPWHG